MIHGLIHTRQTAGSEETAQARGPRGRAWSWARALRTRGRGWGGATAALVVLAVSAACGEDGPTPPDALRRGQIGRIEVVMDTPLRFGSGRLVQRLSWGSNGERTLQESISYGSRTGDDRFERYLKDLEQSAGAYAEAITTLNEVEGVKLFIADLPTDTLPECGPGRTSVAFSIVDDARGETWTWNRCVEGSLGTILQVGAGPDPAAARIAQAVQIVRDAVFGGAFASQYAGSEPFGTLDRGTDSNARLPSPEVFTDTAEWRGFWTQHAPDRPLPEVDFERDMVLVAMVGEREEAGDSVEVRRILQVDQGTISEVVERVPGNFCSPAARVHVPYHIVVAPSTPAPYRFQVNREEVPCGG